MDSWSTLLWFVQTTPLTSKRKVAKENILKIMNKLLTNTLWDTSIKNQFLKNDLRTAFFVALQIAKYSFMASIQKVLNCIQRRYPLAFTFRLFLTQKQL